MSVNVRDLGASGNTYNTDDGTHAHKDADGGYQLTGFATDDEIKSHITDLYANAFGRDPVFNDDTSDTADYWLGAVRRGDHGGHDWQRWLDDSIYGSQERSRLPAGLTEHDKDFLSNLKGKGGGYSGPSMADFQKMLQDTFGNPWTPWGYGWGGNNSDAVRINRSQASRRGSSYAGNKSSFNRSGSRLNTQGTPWMSTLNI